MTFRGLLLWIHLALGLTGAVIIGIAGLTGVYITFQRPLSLWLNPVPRVANHGPAMEAGAIVAAVESRFAPRRAMSLNSRDGEATVVALRDRTVVFVDPADASIIGSRRGRFASLNNLTLVMRGLHTNLLLGPRGQVIVTAATFEALFLVLTGLWLWWRKKYWRFGAWRGSAFRVSWDLHSATGIWFALPVLVMVVTGILISMPSPVYRVAGAEPAPWLNPPLSGATGAGEPVPLSLALVVADSALPAVAVTGLNIPAGPRGAFGMRKGARTVYVDQYSGALIEVRPDRVPTAGDEATEAVERAHTGALFGIVGRAIMTLGSFMLALMTVTGVVLGLKRLLILAGRWGRDAEA